jgi:LacI family transcriptional regulator
MKTSNHKPTLDDVARIAGVSSITVSRLVNGGSRVRPETARKIRAAIARVGYKPNEAARILKGGLPKIIGLIVPDLADPFYGTCAQAVYEIGRGRSYMTIVVGSGYRADVELLEIEMMIHRRVAGLLLIPTGVDKTPIKKIQDAGLPVVCFDRTLPGLETDAVVVNNRDSSYEAVKHLIGHGHKNILCLGNQSDLYPIRLRIQGYEDAVREAGLPSIVVERADTLDALDAELTRLMNPKQHPTAVFCVNSLASMLLLEAAALRHYQITKQLAMIGFDDFKMAALLKPALTVVRQPAVEMSQRAASILLDRLASSSHGLPATVILSTELVIRESCGCKPQK